MSNPLNSLVVTFGYGYQYAGTLNRVGVNFNAITTQDNFTDNILFGTAGVSGGSSNNITNNVSGADEMVARVYTLSPSGGNSPNLVVDLSGVGASEVQTITVTATGGTFTVTYNGQTTAAQSQSVTLANLQTALQGLSSIGANNVVVTGTPGSSYVLTFAGALANQYLNVVTLGTGSLTGGSASAAITTPGATPLTDILNQSNVTLARVKAIRLQVLNATQDPLNGTACTSVTVGNLGTDDWINQGNGAGGANTGWLGSATSTFVIANGCRMSYETTTAFGVGVDATHKYLKFTNNDVTNSAALRIEVIGGTQ